MKRFALALAIGILLAVASLSTPQPAKAPSQAVPDDVTLQVTGDVQVVKVDKVVIVKEDRTVVNSFPFGVQAPTGAGLYFWTVPANVTAIDRGDRLQVTAAPKGALTVSVKLVSADLDPDGKFKGFKNQFGQVSFHIGAVTPEPPPDPDPKPKPPEPKPDGTSPFAEAGFRVMIAFRTNVLRTQGERDVIFGKAVRDYLDAKCVLGPASEKDERGQTMREWRIWPANTDAKLARPVLRDAWEKRGKEQDWILIGDGTRGTSEAMPKTEAEALALLKKFGG